MVSSCPEQIASHPCDLPAAISATKVRLLSQRSEGISKLLQEETRRGWAVVPPPIVDSFDVRFSLGRDHDVDLSLDAKVLKELSRRPTGTRDHRLPCGREACVQRRPFGVVKRIALVIDDKIEDGPLRKRGSRCDDELTFDDPSSEGGHGVIVPESASPRQRP